jgi:hypothetical protein
MSQYIPGRPETSEHAAYYGKYVQLVPENDIILAMTTQVKETATYLRGLPEPTAQKRYAPGKWSVAEVIGHMSDTERLFAARALHFARNTPGALPSMEPDDWMKVATFGTRPLGDLIAEFESVRQSSMYFFRHLPEDAWTRRGVASSNEVSVRALAYIIVGHERHHLNILKTRYADA